MDFELKNVVSVGDVQSVDDDNSLQWVNITAGVVGCPYKMEITTTEKYVFSNALSVQQAKDGIVPFAENFVATTYPSV